jgi:hypothetical protein
MKSLFIVLILSAFLSACAVAPYGSYRGNTGSTVTSGSAAPGTPTYVGRTPLTSGSGAPVYSGSGLPVEIGSGVLIYPNAVTP